VIIDGTDRQTDRHTNGRTIDRYIDPPLDTYTLSNYLRFDPFVWPQPVLFIYYLSEINEIKIRTTDDDDDNNNRYTNSIYIETRKK